MQSAVICVRCSSSPITIVTGGLLKLHGSNACADSAALELTRSRHTRPDGPRCPCHLSSHAGTSPIGDERHSDRWSGPTADRLKESQLAAGREASSADPRTPSARTTYILDMLLVPVERAVGPARSPRRCGVSHARGAADPTPGSRRRSLRPSRRGAVLRARQPPLPGSRPNTATAGWISAPPVVTRERRVRRRRSEPAFRFHCLAKSAARPRASADSSKHAGPARIPPVQKLHPEGCAAATRPKRQ
jgi:hypothetical protein